MLFVLLVFVEVGVGEEDGDLLLAAAVEEAEAPGRGLVVGVEAAVELGAATNSFPADAAVGGDQEAGVVSPGSPQKSNAAPGGAAHHAPYSLRSRQ